MGRRHFNFDPSTRALQASLEVSCRVGEQPVEIRTRATPIAPPEDVTDHVPSRRLFGDRQAPGGSTCDAFDISSKRHCQPPEIDPNYMPPCSVRRYPVDVEHRETMTQDQPVLGGRRHVPGPKSFLSGSGPEVGRSDSVPCGKRHCEPSKPEKLHVEMRRGGEQLPPQRRHRQADDHLQHSSALPSRSMPGRPEGLRCCQGSPTHWDSGTAFALGSALPVDAVGQDVKRQDAPPTPGRAPPRPQTPGRRRLDVEDNLVGGALRGPGAKGPTVPRPSRRPAKDGSSLVGGCVPYNVSTSTNHRSASPFRYKPQDNLVGAGAIAAH